jgi:hypothetical protein
MGTGSGAKKLLANGLTDLAEALKESNAQLTQIENRVDS